MPYDGSVYPIAFSTPRTTTGRSMYPVVVISPPTMTRPVVVKLSQATRDEGSCRSASSSTASETWSHTLSGCPSPTLSEVKMKSFLWLTKHPPTTGTVSKKLRRALKVDPGFLALFYVVAICRKSFHGIHDPGGILLRAHLCVKPADACRRHLNRSSPAGPWTPAPRAREGHPSRGPCGGRWRGR